MRGTKNLCSGGRNARLKMATAGLALVIVQVIVLSELDLPPLWWLTLAAPLFMVSFQLVQAYTGVCVVHAHGGTRAVGGTVEPILDPRKRAELRRMGRNVTLGAVALATSATMVAVALALIR